MGQEQLVDKPKIGFDYYMRVRACGLSPLQVRENWSEMHKEIDGGVGDKIISIILSMVVVAAMVIMLVRRRVASSKIWITSPSGKSIKEVQFYSALRIIRKRGWHLTEVSPKREKEKITRFMALKMAVLGGKG